MTLDDLNWFILLIFIQLFQKVFFLGGRGGVGIQQQANSQKGAYGYSTVTTNVGAPTKNLQHIKHKHAD